MFPEFVRKEIKESFIVRNVGEASIVFDALSKVTLTIMNVYHSKQ